MVFLPVIHACLRRPLEVLQCRIPVSLCLCVHMRGKTQSQLKYFHYYHISFAFGSNEGCIFIAAKLGCLIYII